MVLQKLVGAAGLAVVSAHRVSVDGSALLQAKAHVHTSLGECPKGESKFMSELSKAIAQHDVDMVKDGEVKPAESLVAPSKAVLDTFMGCGRALGAYGMAFGDQIGHGSGDDQNVCDVDALLVAVSKLKHEDMKLNVSPSPLYEFCADFMPEGYHYSMLSWMQPDKKDGRGKDDSVGRGGKKGDGKDEGKKSMLSWTQPDKKDEGKRGDDKDEGKRGDDKDEGKRGDDKDEGKRGDDKDEGKRGDDKDEGKRLDLDIGEAAEKVVSVIDSYLDAIKVHGIAVSHTFKDLDSLNPEDKGTVCGAVMVIGLKRDILR